MTITINNKTVIYIFSNEFRNNFSSITMKQQELVPICEKDHIYYFYTNNNELSHKDRVYIKIEENIQGIKNTPITFLLFIGVYNKNTDIHITESKIFIKKQGNTTKTINILKEEYEEIIGFLRMFCDFNLFSTKDESSVIYTQFLQEKISVRVSLFPNEQNTLISLRLIYKNEIFLLQQKNHNLELLEKVLINNQLMFICGVTGRGKTTLMYALILLYSKNDSSKMIISAEDPVEQILPGVIQRSLYEEDYSTILKSILRHRPDLIIIGEIRDEKAANGLIRALLTGHKVICTLHIVENGNIKENILNRMRELGIERNYLEPYLNLAVVMKENYEYNINYFNITC